MKKKSNVTKKSSSNKKAITTSKPKETVKARNHKASQKACNTTPHFMYNSFSEDKLLSSLKNSQNLSEITKALQGVEPWLFSLIQDMPKGMFKDTKKDAQFSADLNNILHSLKKLSSLVHKNFMDK